MIKEFAIMQTLLLRVNNKNGIIIPVFIQNKGIDHGSIRGLKKDDLYIID